MFLAYIDPGTGSQLVAQGGPMVLAFIGTVVGVIALFFKKILAFFKGLFSKKK